MKTKKQFMDDLIQIEKFTKEVSGLEEVPPKLKMVVGMFVETNWKAYKAGYKEGIFDCLKLLAEHGEKVFKIEKTT